MRRTVVIISMLFIVGCTEESTSPLTPQIKKQDEYTQPYTHPRFIKDTSWNEDNNSPLMESPGTSTDWSYPFVTDTTEAIRKGWRAQRFEVRFGDCVSTDCDRAPVWERREFREIGGAWSNEGDEYWYGWSFYVPKNNNNTLYWTYISQFQQFPNNNPIFTFLKREGKGLCLLMDPRKNVNYDCYKETTVELIPDHLFMGRWHDIVVHAKWKKDSTGVLQIWVNDELKVDYRGYTMTTENTNVVFKYGIYRQIQNNPSIVYFDEVRKGITREQVDIKLLSK